MCVPTSDASRTSRMGGATWSNATTGCTACREAAKGHAPTTTARGRPLLTVRRTARRIGRESPSTLPPQDLGADALWRVPPLELLDRCGATKRLPDDRRVVTREPA